MPNRPLGKTQLAFLRAMQPNGYRGERPYYPGCGWHWDGHARSVAIAESLVRRGLVEVYARQLDVASYRLTDAGRAVETRTR